MLKLESLRTASICWFSSAIIGRNLVFCSSVKFSGLSSLLCEDDGLFCDAEPGEPVGARFARAFAEAPVTVQPAGPAAEVFVLAPIVRAPTVMAQLEVKDLWPRSGLPRSGPSQRPGEELSN